MNTSELAYAAELLHYVSWNGRFPKGTSFEFIQKLSIEGLIDYKFLFGKPEADDLYQLKVTDKGEQVRREWRKN